MYLQKAVIPLKKRGRLGIALTVLLYMKWFSDGWTGGCDKFDCFGMGYCLVLGLEDIEK
ncbi:MAG TPA: hypothetical protein H9733_00820 [Candidatus Anaerotignum merdipullorum]|nr:hypothetical protein [Candidatus Anaerotignum merdipullorum]